MLRLAQFVVLVLLAATPAHAQLVAAVLPSARSVQIGHPAAAFATVINTGSSTAMGCSIAPITAVPATFTYQTTDERTNLPVGTPNTPVDIPRGGAQTFVFAFTASTGYGGGVQLRFACASGEVAPVVPGLNTLTLSVHPDPAPDLAVIAATPSNDGILTVSGTQAALALALVDIGGPVGATRSFGLSVNGADHFSWCRTDPATGACIATNLFFSPGQVITISIFLTFDTPRSFDPERHRVSVTIGQLTFHCVFGTCFQTGQESQGGTSVAVRTAP